MLESVRAGRITEVPGPHDSIMAGLNAGLPSLVAWPDVADGFDLFCAVDDDAAVDGMRRWPASGWRPASVRRDGRRRRRC